MTASAGGAGSAGSAGTGWEGHPFACVLRVDVEQREAERYTGDARSERVATTMLLDQLAQWDVRASCAVLGVTAEHYPDVVRAIAAAGHDVLGHSMFHEPAYSQMPLADQCWDHRRSREAIQDACGVRITGIAAHYHGLTNDETYASAALEGFRYLLGRQPAALGGDGVSGSARPAESADTRGFAPFIPEGADRPILARAGRWLGASDWSARRREWPWIEEPWSPETARQKWRALVDQAHDAGTLVSYVVHPWMFHINEGELPVIREVLAYARERGAWMTTYGTLAERAQRLAAQ